MTHLSYAEDRQLALRYPDIGVILRRPRALSNHRSGGPDLDQQRPDSDAKSVARIDLRKDATESIATSP